MGAASVQSRQGSPVDSRLVAAIGACVGGFGLYLLIAGSWAEYDWKTRLSLGQGESMGLEGAGLFLAFVAGVLVGAPFGTYLAMRFIRAERAAQTAGWTLLLVVLWSFIAPNAAPVGPDDPVILPWILFGGWGVCAAIARAGVERSINRVKNLEL